ncbi:MAG: thioredoxin-disulfide reductase [Candidatus Heimdallarchaeota archaeon]|nr:thioredoxin-disulfide reductase [Candidatus Heimdallarchaeota archaeon]
MTDEQVRNVIIIGGGPAGYTAGIYAARGAVNPLILAGYQAGGQLMLTTEIENFPGFPEAPMGPKLMDDMRLQAEKFGAEILNEDVTEVDFSTKPFIVKTYDQQYQAHSVIIATGASAKWLGLDAEQKLIGTGVSSCATCDGALFKGKEVAIVGGGDTAMEEALYLTKHASKVYVIHRRDELRASKIMRERVLNHPKIEMLWNSIVVDLNSEKEGFIEKLTSLVIEDTQTKERREHVVDGLFVAIGHKPNTGIFEGKVDMHDGYINVFKHTMTSVEGIFAAGDVVDIRYRQAITAAAEGAKAAIDAERWLGETGLVE